MDPLGDLIKLESLASESSQLRRERSRSTEGWDDTTAVESVTTADALLPRRPDRAARAARYTTLHAHGIQRVNAARRSPHGIQRRTLHGIYQVWKGR